MRMKGRLTIAVCMMITVMAFSITVYADAPDPEAVFHAANQKYDELSYKDVHLEYSMHQTEGDRTQDWVLATDTKNKEVSPFNTQMVQYTSEYLDGELASLQTEYYDTGVFYYMDGEGLKVKWPVDHKTLTDTPDDDALSFTYDDLEAPGLTTEGDNQLLTFGVSSEKAEAIVREVLGDDWAVYLASMGAKAQTSGVMTINRDGCITRFEIKLEYNSVLQDPPVYVEVAVSKTINNPGQSFEITAPDTSGCQEVERPLLDGPGASWGL